jgi:hypothetical protein
MSKTLKKNGNGSKTLAVIKPRKPEPSLGMILQTVVDRGITKGNVDTVKELMMVYERGQARDAEKVFAAAFNKLQKHIPEIKATKPVPGKDGTTRFKYEPLYKIEKKLRPLALKYGFTYTLSELMPPVPGHVTKVCTIQHIGGHMKSNTFSVRCGEVPHGSAGQNSMADHQYAKRGVVCDAFGIVVDHEDDATMEGKPITVNQAAELRQMVRESGRDEAKFLKWAGAEKYEDIMDTKYNFLYAKVEEAIRNGKAKKTEKTESKETRDPFTGEFNW